MITLNPHPIIKPGEQFRYAVWYCMEEAEMFGDMNAAERQAAVAYLDTFPDTILAAIGRAMLNAAKEAAR